MRVLNCGNRYEKKRERICRKRTRGYERLTWLGENESAENDWFVDYERSNAHYIRER